MSVAKKSAKKKSSPSKAPAKKGAAPSKSKSASSSKTAAKPTRSTGAKSAKPAAKSASKSSAKVVGKSPKAGAKKGAKKAASLTKKTRVSLPPPSPDGVALRRIASKKLALELVGAALEKKAERAEIIDVSERVDYADYVVLLSGRSDVQLGAIAQSVEDAVKKHGTHPRYDGRRGAAWIVLDCGDVWVHAFLEDARKYYDIEGLWSDAPRVDLPKDMIPRRTSLMPLPSDEEDGESDE